MVPTKNEEREGASITPILHSHPYIILHNEGAYLIWY